MPALAEAAFNRDDLAPWRIGKIRGRLFSERLQQACSLIEADDIDGAKKIIEQMLNGIRLFDGEPEFKLCLSGAVTAAETHDIPTLKRNLAEAIAWLSSFCLPPRQKIVETDTPV